MLCLFVYSFLFFSFRFLLVTYFKQVVYIYICQCQCPNSLLSPHLCILFVLYICFYLCFVNKFICSIFPDSTYISVVLCCAVLSHFSRIWPFVTLLDHNPAGSSVHGILQARILEWVNMPSSRESSWSRDWACVSYVSCIDKQILYH